MAEAMIVNAGQSVGQGDWEALAVQHGGVKSSSMRAPTEAEIKAAAMAGDDDPAMQQRPIYRYYFNDGTFVEARTASNGADYQVVDYKPSSQFTRSQTRTTTSEKPTIGRVEGTPMPDGTYDNTKPIWVERDPVTGQQVGPAKPLTAQQREQWEREKNGGKTDAEMRAANEEKVEETPANRPGWVQIKRTKGGNIKTTFRGPDGKEVDTLPEETKTGSKQFVHSDGKTYFEVTETKGNVTSVYVTDSDGNRVTLPGKESRTSTQKRAPNGQVYYEVSVEKDGKKDTYTSSDPEGANRIAPPGQSVMEGVKGVPTFTPDLTKPGAGLVDRQKQLDELLQAGTITWEQRQAILQQDVQTAQTVAGEFNSAATVLREDYQQRVSQRSSDMTQANTRANLANTYVQNAQGLVEKFAPYLGATPGDAGKLFVGMMASQLAQATMMGGMDTVAREEMDPRLRSWIDSRMPGAPGAAVPPGPGQAVAAGVAATAAAGANPTGQNVQAATDATMQGSNAAFGALGIPPVGADPQAAARAESEAVRQAHAASGQPLPDPIFRPAPPATAPGFLQSQNWGDAPVGMGLPDPLAGGNAMAGEALFGKTLPEPQSWRQGAEQQAFALTMPQQQQAGVGEALFGGSLPQWQAPAMPDYSLPPIQGAGGMDPIDAEARRQLAAAGVLV